MTSFRRVQASLSAKLACERPSERRSALSKTVCGTVGQLLYMKALFERVMDAVCYAASLEKVELRIESVRRWSNLVLLLPSDEITPNRLSTPISALRRTLSQARGMALTPLDTGTRAL